MRVSVFTVRVVLRKVITASVIATYIGFTVPFTEWRNKFRREMTVADDAFNQKATDSLLNFETIKLFRNRTSA